MADQPSSHSGSRWEPVPGSEHEPTLREPAQDGPSSYGPTPYEPTPYEATPDDAAARDRRPRRRIRAALAGVATALALGGGLTGFAIGHGAGGDDGFRPADISQQGPPSFGDHDEGEGSDDGGLGQPTQQLGGSSGDSSSPGDSGAGADPA